MSSSTATTPSTCTNKSPPRSAAPSPTAKPNPANDSRPPKTSPRARRQHQHRPRALRELRDEGLLEFRRGRGITVTGTPQQSAVIERAKELLHYARTQGYKPDELIQIIQQLG